MRFILCWATFYWYFNVKWAIEGQNVTVMKLNIYSVYASADRLLNLDSIVESSVYIKFNFGIDWKTFHLF